MQIFDKPSNFYLKLNFLEKFIKFALKPFIQIKLFVISYILAALFLLFIIKFVNKSFKFLGVEKDYDKNLNL